MRPQLHISIPQPCQNRWADMAYVDENKRHCSSCEKVITDFTRMSDEQLLGYFKYNAVTCGKFAKHQLNRNIESKRKQNRSWLATFLLPALITVADLSAQGNTSNEVVITYPDSSRREIKLPIDVIPTWSDTMIIQGKVFEISDSLGESPLPGAVLIFKMNNGETFACVSDSDARFLIKLDSAELGDTVNVEVRYSGYSPYFTSLVLMKEVLLAPVEIRLSTRELSVVGALPVIHPVRSKIRGFFWRLFHPRSWSN